MKRQHFIAVILSILVLPLAACTTNSGLPQTGTVPPAPTMPEKVLSVEINSPEDGAKLSTNLLKVTGTVSDAQAVVEISETRARVGKDGAFYAYVELSEGMNTVEVLATMADHHVGQAINVHFDPPLVLVLDYPRPEPGMDYTRTPVKISGYVSFPAAKVTVDEIQTEVENDGSFSAEIQLKEGLNYVEVETTLSEKRDYTRYSINVTPEGSFVAAPPMGGARLGTADIKLKAGEAKTSDIRLETGKRDIRRPGELRWEVYRVSELYGKDQLPMPEGLDVGVEPPSFIVYPGRTYLSTIAVTATPDFAPGEYYFHLGAMVDGGLVTGFTVIVEH